MTSIPAPAILLIPSRIVTGLDGVTYLAASGFTASEVDSTLALAIDNLTVTGALSSDTLNADDLAAGLYDNASIEIWRVVARIFC